MKLKSSISKNTVAIIIDVNFPCPGCSSVIVAVIINRSMMCLKDKIVLSVVIFFIRRFPMKRDISIKRDSLCKEGTLNPLALTAKYFTKNRTFSMQRAGQCNQSSEQCRLQWYPPLRNYIRLL